MSARLLLHLLIAALPLLDNPTLAAPTHNSSTAHLNTTHASPSTSKAEAPLQIGVYICTSDNWAAPCFHILTPPNSCVDIDDLFPPGAYPGSFGPDEGAECELYP